VQAVWLTPAESSVGPLELSEAVRVDGRCRHSLIVWLQTPMSSGSVAPWRRAIRWLQSQQEADGSAGVSIACQHVVRPDESLVASAGFTAFDLPRRKFASETTSAPSAN